MNDDRPTKEQIAEARRELATFSFGGRVYAKYIDVLIAATASDPGPPRPADMAELAKLVAKELRGRGFFADYWHGHTITLPRYNGNGSAKVLLYLPICLDLSQFNNLTPSEIADVIQAEEAKKAAEWAGDE